ncbi:hypothetical protein GCM10009589_31140 [Arthrobacter pascens]
MVDGPFGHRPGSVRGAVQIRVVQQDDVLVPAQLHIALHAVSTFGKGPKIGRPGVLREIRAGAPVRVDQGTGSK